MPLDSECTLILGDCIEKMKDIPNNSIDLILTDVPYGLSKDMQNDSISGLEEMLTLAFKEFKRVSKKKHSILIFFDAGKNLPIAFKAIDRAGLFFERYINFYKPNDCSMPHCRVLRKSEALLLCSEGGVLNHDGDEYMHDSIKANHCEKDKSFYHPSVKDLGLVEKLIRVNTKRGEVVLDAFMGSGTTGVGCMHCGRRFIGIELDKRYYDIAEKRIVSSQKQSKLYSVGNGYE